MKKILILGGTQFIGRNLVQELVRLNKYDLTLFNRQKTSPELFQKLKKIKGDKETDDIQQLVNKNWDFVIDISCYYPNSLENLISKLKGKIGRYIFISTISVYQWEQKLEPNVNEDCKISNCKIEERNDVLSKTYGKRKAECERVLMRAKWLDKIILRPSIIYGKYDKTDRLYYWINKVNLDKPFITPEENNEKITLTYVKDLVNIIIKAIEIKEHTTIYNTTTHQPITLKNILNIIEKLVEKKSNFIEVTSKKLIENEVHPEVDLPLWFNNHLSLSNIKLKTDFEIELTDFEQSILETINYYKNLNWPKTEKGLNTIKEQQIIKKICSSS